MELFSVVCETNKVPTESGSQWLENIKRQYLSENRHFHNLYLIEKKLSMVLEIAKDEVFLDALVLATVFQYFHYDVKRDLKKENCNEFRLFIDQTGIKNETLVADVLAMLQDESTQMPETSSNQIDLFNDLDLAVLGSSSEDYKKYSESLQREYSTESYKKDRLKMLKTLLMIPFIYSNQKMREKFETAARQNIQSEIDELMA